MRGRLATLAFILYVALDLSNPFHPGAFNFDPEECIEAAPREQEQASVDCALDGPRLRAEADSARPVVPRAPASAPRTAWRLPAPLAHAASPPSSGSPPSPVEDH
jgi:hypothetical protein